MECKRCKVTIEDGSAYCNHCGAKQVEKLRTRRGNGFGSVYKRDTVWQAEVTLGYYMEDGSLKRRRIRKSGFKTKREALEYIESLKNKKKTDTVNFSSLWDSFQTAKNTLSDSKKTAYNIAWKKIQPLISYRNIDDVTADELQDITDKCGTSYYTKRDIKNLLSHLYKLALRDEYVLSNKACFILLPKLNAAERDIFTPEEIERFWSDFGQSQSVISAHMLIMLYTGMRPGEILTLQKSNINMAGHFMTGGIKTVKSRNRKIIISNKIVPLIEFLMQSHNLATLSPYKNEDAFYADWAIKKEELGLSTSMMPYCCRHTFVTNCTRLNMSPAMLQELTGHEDYDTTLTYTHLSVEDRLREINKL